MRLITTDLAVLRTHVPPCSTILTGNTIWISNRTWLGQSQELGVNMLTIVSHVATMVPQKLVTMLDHISSVADPGTARSRCDISDVAYHTEEQLAANNFVNHRSRDCVQK